MSRRNRKGRAVHGILLLDKPAGGSSNHALQRVKRLFNARKAGHTGSLDPLATGMLPICLGEATKLAGHLIDADKGYETTLQLGVTTDSADADGEVIVRRDVPVDLTPERFAAICAAFVGSSMQVPPMVSAIKVGGQRLYKLAREGVTIERAPRAVVIHSLEVIEFEGDTARLAVRCSKGTYIRSLVTDIGEVAGCGAHVTALRRTFVAPFEGQPMLTIEALEQRAAAAGTIEAGQLDLDAALLPIDAGLPHLPELEIDAAAVAIFRSGQSATVCGTAVAPADVVDMAADTSSRESGESDLVPKDAATLWRVRGPSGRLIGLGHLLAEGGAVAPTRVIQWE